MLNPNFAVLNLSQNICCCLRLKSKQISELLQKHAFNGFTGVITYADPEYINANITEQYFMCYSRPSLVRTPNSQNTYSNNIEYLQVFT